MRSACSAARAPRGCRAISTYRTIRTEKRLMRKLGASPRFRHLPLTVDGASETPIAATVVSPATRDFSHKYGGMGRANSTSTIVTESGRMWIKPFYRNRAEAGQKLAERLKPAF